MGHKKLLGTVIGVGNQKGGVGKTTNTVHLAAALGLRGYKSLIIDLDPSAGATRHLGIPENSYAGTLELLTTDEEIETLAITEKMPRGVHLIPSRLELAELEKHIPKFTERTKILESTLESARNLYDFVWLDTPPNPGAILTIATYVSADWFVLSVFPHHLAVRSLAAAFEDIADVRSGPNPNLEVLGVILTCVDGRVKKTRQTIEQMIRKAVPGRICENITSQSNALPAVSEQGKTLFQSKATSSHPVAEQYRRLAAELEHRIMNREAFIAGTLGPPDYEALLAKPTGEGASEEPASLEDRPEERAESSPEIAVSAGEETHVAVNE